MLLTVGWTTWATSPKRNDLLSWFSLSSFALASGSAALVVAAIAYIIWVGGLPHYDPRLIRFIVWGLLVSLTALAASIPGLWRTQGTERICWRACELVLSKRVEKSNEKPRGSVGHLILITSVLSVIQMFLRSIHTSRLHRTDDLTSANAPDATSAIRFRAGRVFPAFAAILIPASVLSKKSARLSMSVRASSSPSI